MRAPIKIEDKGQIYKGSVPTSWDDITLKEFYKFSEFSLKPRKDFIQFYADMTGIPYEILYKSREGSVQTSIDALTAWLWQNPGDAELHKRPVPKTFKILIGIHEKIVTVPKNLELKQLGQKYAISYYFQELKKTVKSQTEFALERAAGIIAIFMFQEFTGKEDFNLEEALLYKWRIMDLPATQMIPLSVFFWNHFIELARSGPNN